MSMILLGVLAATAVQDAPTAVVDAVDRLCAGGPTSGSGAGFVNADGVFTARFAEGSITVTPAHDGDPCVINGDLSYAAATAAAHTLLDWAEAKRLPWTVRDRHGPVDAWEGPWFMAYTRGGLDIRVEHDNRRGELDPPADSRSRLIVTLAPSR